MKSYAQMCVCECTIARCSMKTLQEKKVGCLIEFLLKNFMQSKKLIRSIEKTTSNALETLIKL